MKKIGFNYAHAHKGHYSAGIISSNTLYISGQLPIDPNTGDVPEGGIEEHMLMALGNLDKVLTQAKIGRDNVIQCRIYISDISYWETVNFIYGKYFQNHKPARTIIPVGKLHYGCLVEIEAMAEVQK